MKERSKPGDRADDLGARFVNALYIALAYLLGGDVLRFVEVAAAVVM